MAPSRQVSKPFKSSSPHQLASLFGSILSPDLFPQAKKGANSRNRLFSLPLTFWAFLWQVLNPGSSCREALCQLGFLFKVKAALHNTAAFCRARKRLPIQVLERCLKTSSAAAQARISSQTLWHGLQVKVVDGTTLSMADTPKNQKRFPQSRSQKKGCGFPIMKVVGLFCLASGAVLDHALDSLHLQELPLFHRIGHRLKKGDLFLADRGFCCFSTLALLQAQGVECLVRLKRGKKNARRSSRVVLKALSPQEELMQWRKPAKAPAYLSKEEWEKMPGKLTVRVIRVNIQAKGMRTRSLELVTTLLDHEAYPAHEVALLYLRRWEVEGHFRELKTVLEMEVLTCKEPQMVEKELLMHLIAYNLVRSLMLEAAMAGDQDVRRISFKGAMDGLRQYVPKLAEAPSKKAQKRMINDLLTYLAQDLVPERLGRREPRAVKRRPKPFQLLNKPRAEMVELSHRSKYRKPESRKNQDLK